MNLPRLPALKTIELNSVISFLYCQNFILLSTNKTSTEILSTDANVRTKIKGCRILCQNRLNSLLLVFQRQFRFLASYTKDAYNENFHLVRSVPLAWCPCNDAFLSADYEVKYCNF